MAIETSCRGCGKRLRVAEEYAGRQARCPECGYVYSVPLASPAKTPEQPLAGPQAASPQATPGATPESEPVSSVFPTSASPQTAPLPQAGPAVDSWYMKTPEGQIYGPVNRTSLEQWVREGRVTDDCQLRRGEHGAWTGAAKIFTQLAAPQYSPTQVGGGTYASGYGAGHAHVQTGHSTGGRYLRPHRGGLIITFAILGWAFCPIFSIMAWSMGTTDMNQMRAGIMDNSGMGITQAGQILGMIHVCLTLLGLGFVFLMILCGVALDA